MLYPYLRPTRSEDGYTLTEMVVVMVMAGVLALIAAPTWNTLMNGRRAAAVQADIVQGLRQTQQIAQQQRSPQTFTLTDTPGALPTFTVAGRTAQPVGNGEVPENQVAVTPNTLTLTFDEQGALAGTTPTPTVINVDVGTARRCVIIENLLGTVRQRSGADCP